MSTPEIDSVAESDQGASTGNVTRKVSALEVIQAVAAQSNPGPRPAAYEPRLRTDSLTRPPLMYDSKNLTALEGYEAHGAPLGIAVTALDAMKAAIESVVSARNKSTQDPTLPSEVSQVLKVADYSDKLMDAALRKVDAANSHLTAQIAAVEGDLSKAVAAGVHTALAAEVRAHAKSHKSPVQFVSELIAAGDAVSVGAVLGAPPFLSGLTPQMRDALTLQWNSKQNPALTAKLTLLRAAQDKLDRAGSAFLPTIERGMGVSYATVKRLRDAKSAAHFG